MQRRKGHAFDISLSAFILRHAHAVAGQIIVRRAARPAACLVFERCRWRCCALLSICAPRDTLHEVLADAMQRR